LGYNVVIKKLERHWNVIKSHISLAHLIYKLMQQSRLVTWEVQKSDFSAVILIRQLVFL